MFSGDDLSRLFSLLPHSSSSRPPLLSALVSRRISPVLCALRVSLARRRGRRLGGGGGGGGGRPRREKGCDEIPLSPEVRTMASPFLLALLCRPSSGPYLYDVHKGRRGVQKSEDFGDLFLWRSQGAMMIKKERCNSILLPSMSSTL